MCFEVFSADCTDARMTHDQLTHCHLCCKLSLGHCPINVIVLWTWYLYTWCSRKKLHKVCHV